MTEPPVRVTNHGRFFVGADVALEEEPRRRTYQHAAKRIAFRALTTGKPAAQLLHVSRTALAGSPEAGAHHVMGSWLIAGPAGSVTAHRGLHIGPGGPWELANAIISGSAHAVQAPTLNGYYRARPDAFRELVAAHATSLQRLLEQHDEAVSAGCLYAAMEVGADPTFLALLRSAINDRGTQLVLHDWLEESGFPHAAELRSKKWNQGKWSEGQLLDLLSKPFGTTRRSFSGQAV